MRFGTEGNAGKVRLGTKGVLNVLGYGDDEDVLNNTLTLCRKEMV